ncbi:MAG: tRNA uridine-5-carboxymethylaminomethyl(34) synthesis GTPase MnmE [Verrucomicrobiales bacterium]|nr:tRNA uridine-5-carboxymethylaminomethyl(34) synthesis GTPase MnmE [Verrucomicrobiales bacterium]
MHPTASETDTIAALATPPGESGLAVLRVSGPASLAVVGRVFVPGGKSAPRLEEVSSHTVHYGHLVRDGQRIDEVLVTVMRAPRTFTREDVVEISCHGGVFVARQVLDTVLAAGARLAQPGEFTKRAFLAGRLDLAQAEAVADLIHARTERALASAHEQLAGGLSRRVNGVRDHLMNVLAHLEAHLDFPDEDIAPDSRARLDGRLASALDGMRQLLETAREGQVLRRGLRVAIVGRPNAGKSSLLNLLLGRDRAIVSPVAGTTRDTIEETANLRGVPVVLVDTAGLRDVAEPLEREGIRRAREAAAAAELVLHVIDGSQPLADADRAFLEGAAGPRRLLVINKVDLPGGCGTAEAEVQGWRVSCETGDGLEALKDAIVREAWSGAAGAGAHEVAINARHEDVLRRAVAATERACEALRAGRSLEWAAADLRVAVQAVGEIVGRTSTEDLLDLIFGQFCLGK